MLRIDVHHHIEPIVLRIEDPPCAVAWRAGQERLLAQILEKLNTMSDQLAGLSTAVDNLTAAVSNETDAIAAETTVITSAVTEIESLVTQLGGATDQAELDALVAKITAQTDAITGSTTAIGASTTSLSDSVTAAQNAGAPPPPPPPPVELTLDASGVGSGTVGQAYTGVVTATGGAGGYQFSILSGALPDGLSMDGGGFVSGTPGTEGSFSVTVQAHDTGTATGSADITIDIAAAAAPV